MTVRERVNAVGYWLSPQKGQTVERACSGLRQCQQNPFFGASRALSRLRMSSNSVARWSMYANPGSSRGVQLVGPQEGPGRVTTREVFEDGMRRTVEAMRARAFVIVEQVPEQKRER